MTKGRRETRADEAALFHETFKDVRPRLAKKKGRAKTALKAEADVKAAKSSSPSIVMDHPPILPGIDGRTAERLRRGQLEPEARLDLHGLTEQAAYQALGAFLRASQARGLRLVLVVTGKGARTSDDAPFDLELDRRKRGILHALTPRWLKEPALRVLIADLRRAHGRHGGNGALYVYLRKP